MYFEKALVQPGLLGTAEWFRWEDPVLSAHVLVSISHFHLCLFPHYVLSSFNEIWQQSRGISAILWGHKPEKCLGMWASRKGRNVSVLSLRTWVHQHLSLCRLQRISTCTYPWDAILGMQAVLLWDCLGWADAPAVLTPGVQAVH